VEAPLDYVPNTSRNIRKNSVTKQHFVPFPPIHPTQAQVTVEGLSDDRSTDPMNHDKLSALEERLRAIEGNYWFDHI